MGFVWFFTSKPDLPEVQADVTEPWISYNVQVSAESIRKDSEYLLKEKDARVTPAIQSIKIKLLGIVEENGDVIAVVEIGTKDQRIAVGDSFQDGSVLDAIVDSSIMISNDGEVRVISLYEKEL